MNAAPQLAENLYTALRARRVLNQLDVSDGGFLFDPSTGKTFSINRTARTLLYLLQRERRLPAVIKALAEHYQLTEEQSRSTVEHFLQQLGTHL